MRQIAVLNDEPYPRVGELRRLQRPSGLLDRYVPAQLIRRQFRNKLVKSDWVFVIFWPRRPELSGGVEPTGECRQTLAGHTDAVLSVAVSSDGTTAVSGSADKTVRVWDLTTGECRQTLAGTRMGCSAWSSPATARRTGVGVGGQDRPRLGPHDGGVPSDLGGHTDGVLSVAVSSAAIYD